MHGLVTWLLPLPFQSFVAWAEIIDLRITEDSGMGLMVADFSHGQMVSLSDQKVAIRERKKERKSKYVIKVRIQKGEGHSGWDWEGGEK